MRARVEALKTFEEFDHCAGDKVAAMEASRRVTNLAYIKVGGKSGGLVKHDHVDPAVEAGAAANVDAAMERPESTMDVRSPRRARYVESTRGSEGGVQSSSLFRSTSSGVATSPAPPKAGATRRQWHLFQPNPELLQQRKRILHERRKRAQWKKEREQKKADQRAQQERILAMKIYDNEAKKKLDGVVGKNKKKKKMKMKKEKMGEDGRRGMTRKESDGGGSYSGGSYGEGSYGGGSGEGYGGNDVGDGFSTPSGNFVDDYEEEEQQSSVQIKSRKEQQDDGDDVDGDFGKGW